MSAGPLTLGSRRKPGNGFRADMDNEAAAFGSPIATRPTPLP